MKIFIVCPAPVQSLRGNRVTAVRWRRILRGLGHRVTIGQEWHGQGCAVMIALHARKSHSAIKAYRRGQPEGPLIVCLTGTDVYRDLRRSKLAWRSLDWADRIVVLQPKAAEALPAGHQSKVRVLWQSAQPVASALKPRRGFTVCVLGHLRHEKDPFRAALALRWIPPELPLRVLHAGQALGPAYARRARQWMTKESRYRWLGELPRGQARQLLAASEALIISSRMEGGANVVSEAIVQGVPVLASDIPGNVGMFGDDYPGYFPVGDAKALAELLQRLVGDAVFRKSLQSWCQVLAKQFTPEGEREAWRGLLQELRINS